MGPRRARRRLPRRSGSGDQPLLLLNGYNVEDGCRVNTSIFRSDPSLDAAKCDEAVPGQDPLLRTTADTTTLLCGDQDLRVPRRPPVSWPGFPTSRRRDWLRAVHTERPRTRRPRRPEDEDPTRRGGRRRRVPRGTSGASTVARAVATPAHGVRRAHGHHGVGARPIFLQIPDNGFSSTRRDHERHGRRQPVHDTDLGPSSPRRRARRTGPARPASSCSNPTGRRSPRPPIPRSSAPLGWVLSTDAREDLRRQLRVPATATAIVELRAKIAAAAGSCS